MHESAWAAVAVAIIMEVGRGVREWLRYHYHVIETPTRMADVQVTSKCKELDVNQSGKMQEQIDDNSASIGALKIQVEEQNALTEPPNPRSR